MQHYLRTEEVLSPQVIAERERYYLPYLDVKGNALPIVMGVSFVASLSGCESTEEIKKRLHFFEDEQYVMSDCVCVCVAGLSEG